MDIIGDRLERNASRWDQAQEKDLGENVMLDKYLIKLQEQSNLEYIEGKEELVPYLEKLWQIWDQEKLSYGQNAVDTESFQSMFNANQDDYRIFICKQNGNLVGGCCVMIFGKNNNYKEKYGYIWLIMVDKKYRGMGVGQQLLNMSKEWLFQNDVKQISLDVRTWNKKAQAFYKKNGFKLFNLTLSYFKECTSCH